MVALIQPVTGRITSAFGAPRSYGGHVGIDFACPVGTPVKAAAAGRVIASGWISDAAGIGIKVEHGDVTTVYFHLSRTMVNVGDYVQQGHVVALSGATGEVSGAHLHFEVRVAGRAIDPAYALKYGAGASPLPQSETSMLPGGLFDGVLPSGMLDGEHAPYIFAGLCLLLAVVVMRR